MFLLIMVLTGRTVDEVIAIIFKNSKQYVNGDQWVLHNGKVVLVNKIQRPIHNKVDKDLLVIKSDLVVIPLPEKVSKLFLEYKSDLFVDTKEEILNLIREINKANNLNLTAGRISGFMEDLLKRSNVDEVDVGLILGDSPKHLAGLYYYNNYLTELLELYCRYLKVVLSNANVVDEIPELNKENRKLVGSEIVIAKSKVAKHYGQLRSLLNQENYCSGSVYEFHNHFVAYTNSLLSFGTAHRPVVAPFENIKDINLFTGSVYINDKDNRNGQSSRLVYLPSEAIQQVKNYIEHLRELKKQCGLEYPEVGKYIDLVMKGERPLLFYFEENSLRTIRPKWLEVYFEDKFPIPLNWNRHFMRTELPRHGHDGGLISAWMGHSDIGNETFGMFSGLSVNSLKDIEICIDDIFEEMKISAVKGWRFIL